MIAVLMYSIMLVLCVMSHEIPRWSEVKDQSIN